MASEIRILEDQLYDADYQNRVLRDELTRVKEKCEPESGVVDSQNFGTQDYGPAIPPPVFDTNDKYQSHVGDQPLQDIQSDTILDDGFGSGAYSPPSVPYVPVPMDDFPAEPGTVVGDTQPFGNDNVIDSGVQSEKTDARDPDPSKASSSTANKKKKESDSGSILPAPKTATPKKATPRSTFENLPAPRPVPIPPSEPEPPGQDSLRAPPLSPGKPIPPASDGIGEPAGGIKLPKSVNDLIYSKPQMREPSQPQHIQLHSGLSCGHQFDQDDEVDGMYLVINVIGDDGHAINLRDFDINASLTVVVLDPSVTTDGTDALASRVGRWDFNTDQVSTFVRSVPVDGLHIPIEWLDIEPTGDEVVVHVRLQAESEEMRCQGRIQLNKDNAIAKWMPRGEKLR